MVEKGYKVGEVDISYGDKSIEEQFYDTSKHYLGKGDVAITGDGPDGSTTFKVSNFQTPDGKTVTGYGVYKIKEGYAKFFNFIEIASSKDPIKDLDQGLQSGNHYLVGFQCEKKDKCDQSKAMPSKNLTPAFEFEYGFDKYDEDSFLQQ